MTGLSIIFIYNYLFSALKSGHNNEVVVLAGWSSGRVPMDPLVPLLSVGGGLEYKKVGMLVVSLRGVNFRFWSHLGC